MSSALLMLFLFCCCGFVAMYICFAPLTRQYLQTLQLKFYMQPILYVWLLYAAGCIGAYFLCNHHDFIEPLTLTRVLLPLGLTVLIYVAALLFSDIGLILAVCGSVALLVLEQPFGVGSPFPEIPAWGVQLGVICFGIIFCLFYRIMNGTIQALIIPAITILFGIGVLGILGAIPMFCVLSAAMLLGISIAYLSINYYEIKIDFDKTSCTCFAFLIFSLIVMNLGEFSFVPCAVFTMVFWTELSVALWQKYIVGKDTGLMENTNYYIAATKYSHHILAMNIFKICTIGIFLGWFQMVSVNAFSLPFVTYIIILWLNTSFGQAGPNEPKNLKEINRAFMQDLKQNIQDAKDAFNAATKDKK